MTTPVRSTAARFHIRQVDDHALWMQDCRISVLTAAEDTAGRLGVLHIEAPAGHHPPLHVHHDEDEAYFVLAGRLSVRCGDQSAEAGPGAWIYLPRGMAHNLQVLGDQAARFLLVVAPGGFEAFFRDQATPAAAPGLPTPQPPDLELVGRLFARHHVEPVGPPAGTQ